MMSTNNLMHSYHGHTCGVAFSSVRQEEVRVHLVAANRDCRRFCFSTREELHDSVIYVFPLIILITLIFIYFKHRWL